MKMSSENDGEISVMGESGDTKHVWNSRDPDSIQRAREVFTLYRSRGYRAFKMNVKGDQGEMMTDFDAASGRILFVPQMQGG